MRVVAKVSVPLVKAQARALVAAVHPLLAARHATRDSAHYSAVQPAPCYHAREAREIRGGGDKVRRSKTEPRKGGFQLLKNTSSKSSLFGWLRKLNLLDVSAAPQV